MAGNFPYVLVICISFLLLFGVGVWTFAVWRDMRSCRADPKIKCANYACPEGGSDSIGRFGDKSELANNCKDGNCNRCAWDGGDSDCMNEWCKSNSLDSATWNPQNKCRI